MRYVSVKYFLILIPTSAMTLPSVHVQHLLSSIQKAFEFGRFEIGKPVIIEMMCKF